MTTHREQFIDAITNAATVAGDAEVGEDAAQIYRDIEDGLSGLLADDDVPTLAFLSFAQVGSSNHMALTTLLPDRLVVGWRQGLFRKKFESITIPYASITDVSTAPVTADRSLGGNPVLTIQGDRPAVIAIPPKGSPLAEAVKEAVVEGMGPR